VVLVSSSLRSNGCFHHKVIVNKRLASHFLVGELSKDYGVIVEQPVPIAEDSDPCGEIIQPINSAYESWAFRHTCRCGLGRDWQMIATASLGADISARLKSTTEPAVRLKSAVIRVSSEVE